jgi:hypothetical protein
MIYMHSLFDAEAGTSPFRKNAFSVDRPITLAPMRLKYPWHYSLFIRTFVRSQIIMDISSHFIVIKSLQIFSSGPIARKHFDINTPF